MLLFFLGILFTIGAVLDEANGNHDENNYIAERNGSKARTFLVFKWTLLGFFLTISYKSVLRASMMKTQYDDTIDTIDDMIASKRALLVAGDTRLRQLVETDPRPKVQALWEKTKYYEYGPPMPEWVIKG